MADSALAKKRLSINLSFLNLAKLTSTPKSPKIFNDPNGVVGLQILAALNHDDDHHRQDSIFINGFSSGLVPISPKFSSNPIPILTNNNKPIDKSLTTEEMELCEEYTCVITHVGDRLIKKREYFEADLLGDDEHEVCDRIFVVSDNTVSYGAGGAGGFLNTCFLCDKMLDGLDIFMYRGEKAFCSVECRDNHIANDEGKEKRRRRSGKRKPMDCSASPCSTSTSPMQFCAGVAAA